MPPWFHHTPWRRKEHYAQRGRPMRTNKRGNHAESGIWCAREARQTESVNTERCIEVSLMTVQRERRPRTACFSWSLIVKCMPPTFCCICPQLFPSCRDGAASYDRLYGPY